MTLSTVTNGNTIFATDINQIVNEVNQMYGDTGSLSVSGSTSGTATLYQLLQGNAKYVLILVSSTYNSTLKTIALPVAFASRASVRVKGNAGPMRFLAAGVAQTINLVTGFSGTTGVETTVSVTSITAGGGAQGYIGAAFDTVEFSATGAVGPCMVILEGN